MTVRDPTKVAYVTQTTLSVDDTRDIIEALRRRFPDITGPDVKDICYATQNRQQAVQELAARVDMLLWLGPETARIQIGCARSARSTGYRAILSTMLEASIRLGWRALGQSA